MAKRKKKVSFNKPTSKPTPSPKHSFWLIAAIINPVSFSMGLLISVTVLVATTRSLVPIAFETSAAPLFTASPSPTPYPYQIPVPQIPQEPLWLSARGVLILDVSSRSLLYQKNMDAQLLPASTTKIMTALVTLDTFNLDDNITVTTGPESIGNKAELYPGEKITVNDLLYALLLSSGNDAAVTLAQNHPQGYSAFIKAMNQKAQNLGLINTHFTNASGIDSPYHFISPRDLALLALTAYHNDTLRPIFSTKQITVKSQNGYSHFFQNTNQLLGQIEGVTGIKTGWTEEAGECLVTYVDGQHPLLFVVLGSTDRFGETKTLINWIQRNYTWSDQSQLTPDQIASHSAQPKL
jgi:D-alanyl-D-alanine carboxypeptidase